MQLASYAWCKWAVRAGRSAVIEYVWRVAAGHASASVWEGTMTVKHRGQQQARKATARPSSPKAIKPKGAARVRAPKSAMRDHVAPREEVERYERKIAERSPRISPGATSFWHKCAPTLTIAP